MQKLFFLQGNIWMMIFNVAVRMGNKGATQPKIFPKVAFTADLRLLRSTGLPEKGCCALCFPVFHSHFVNQLHCESNLYFCIVPRNALTLR
jgi:hypothetical protein